MPGESYLAGARRAPRRAACGSIVAAATRAARPTWPRRYGKLTGRPGLCFVTRGPGATHAGDRRAHRLPGFDADDPASSARCARDTAIARPSRSSTTARCSGRIAKWAAQIDDAERIPEIRRARVPGRDRRAARPGRARAARGHAHATRPTCPTRAARARRGRRPARASWSGSASCSRGASARSRSSAAGRLDRAHAAPTSQRFAEAQRHPGRRRRSAARTRRQPLAGLRRRRRPRHQPEARAADPRRRPARRDRRAPRRDDDRRLHAARAPRPRQRARPRAPRPGRARPRLPAGAAIVLGPARSSRPPRERSTPAGAERAAGWARRRTPTTSATSRERARAAGRRCRSSAVMAALRERLARRRDPHQRRRQLHASGLHRFYAFHALPDAARAAQRRDGLRRAGRGRRQGAASRTAPVVCIAGDGDFLMTGQELATAVAGRSSTVVVARRQQRHVRHDPHAPGAPLSRARRRHRPRQPRLRRARRAPSARTARWWSAPRISRAALDEALAVRAPRADRAARRPRGDHAAPDADEIRAAAAMTRTRAARPRAAPSRSATTPTRCVAGDRSTSRASCRSTRPGDLVGGDDVVAQARQVFAIMARVLAAAGAAPADVVKVDGLPARRRRPPADQPGPRGLLRRRRARPARSSRSAASPSPGRCSRSRPSRYLGS